MALWSESKRINSPQPLTHLPHHRPVPSRPLTWVIIGKPMMKKQMQQPRVKTGLCVRRYLGNSSEMEVTMVSMVANWNRAKKQTSESNCPIQKAPKSPMYVPPGKVIFALGLVFRLASLLWVRKPLLGPNPQVNQKNSSKMWALEIGLPVPRTFTVRTF
jgi:hypothetical protein